MRIHSDVLTYADIITAVKNAGADFAAIEGLTAHGSRARNRAYNVNLVGNSHRRPNRVHTHSEYAATWDQWGVFFAYLYGVDPDLKTTTYKDEETFHRATGYRFDGDALPSDYHGDHSWVVRASFVHECRHCPAARNFVY